MIIKILLFKRETKRQREEQRGIKKMRQEKRLKEKDIKTSQTIRLKEYTNYLGTDVVLTPRVHLCKSKHVWLLPEGHLKYLP